MLLLRLAWRSLRNRPLTSALTVAAVALSITLLLGVEQARRGMRESFTGTIKGTDLVIGARGGTIQLLLGSVFGIGAPGGKVPFAEYTAWSQHPAVRWTVPLSIGDSHRGFRVIGTTTGLFEHWRYRVNGRLTFAQGAPFRGDEDVVLGADVAEQLGYRMGAKIVVGHGLNAVAGLGDHEAHPFTVVGILQRTFTPLDRALFVSLGGIQEMHGAGEDHHDEEGADTTTSARAAGDHDHEHRDSAAPAAPRDAAPPAMPGAEAPPVMPGATPPPMPGATGPIPAPIVDDPTAISAFLLGTKSRFETLRLQREVNDSKREPLTAVIPGVALAELWKTLGTIEGGLRVVGAMTIVVGLLGMLVALYSSLEARRREMAVLRAVGAGPRTIIGLLVLESGLLTLLGCALGVALVLGGFAAAQGLIEARTGVHIAVQWPGALEWAYIGVVLAAGVLVGLVPAWRAYRSSLADGLSPRL